MILVVEDEYAIAQMLQMFLEDEGYRVRLATNGQEGLARLAEEPPDLILCDLMMPLVGGWQFCQLMQAEPRYRSIPLVLMSAADHSPKGRECNYAAFLTKPFNLDTLLDTIATLLGG